MIEAMIVFFIIMSIPTFWIVGFYYIILASELHDCGHLCDEWVAAPLTFIAGICLISCPLIGLVLL